MNVHFQGAQGQGFADTAARLGDALVQDSFGVTRQAPRGPLASLVAWIKRALPGSQTPTLTVQAARQAGPGQDWHVRLKAAKSPALALEWLSGKLRRPVESADVAVATARTQAQSTASAKPDPAAGATQDLSHGQAQWQVARLSGTMPTRIGQYLTGVRALTDATFGLSTQAVRTMNATARHDLLAQISREYATLHVLKTHPDAALSAAQLQWVQDRLARCVLQVLVPEFHEHLQGAARHPRAAEAFVAQAARLGPSLAALGARGVLQPQLLEAMAQRSDFYARHTADAHVEGEFALHKMDHVAEYITELATAGRLSDDYVRTQFQTARALYDKAVDARAQGDPAPFEDLRLQAYESLVDDLFTFSDRHSALALQIKLTAASDPQAQERVTLRHELNQAKHNLFRLAQESDGGRGVSSTSFRAVALDGLLLDLWQRDGVGSDLNLLIGHALALQASLSQRENALHHGAQGGSLVVIGLDDLRKIGLSAQALSRLRLHAGAVDEILQQARRFAEMGLTHTRELATMRKLAASAFKNVLDSRLVRMATRDIQSLVPAARLEVLDVLLARSRKADVSERLSKQAQVRLAQAVLPGVPPDAPAPLRDPSLRFAQAGERLADEVERLVDRHRLETMEVAVIGSLAAQAGLAVDPHDAGNLRTARLLEGHRQAADLHQQMLSLRDRLQAQLRGWRQAPAAEAAGRAAMAQAEEDIASARQVIRDTELEMAQLQASLRRERSALATRLWNNPATQAFSISGKLASDPLLASLAGSLDRLAGHRLQQKASQQAIQTLAADRQRCLAARQAALGKELHRELVFTLRQAVAAEFLQDLREHEARGGSANDWTFVPASRQGEILARLRALDVPVDAYQPELDDLLLRELALRDVETWISEARAPAAVATTALRASAAGPAEGAMLSADAVHVVHTIGQLQPGERFYLSRGTQLSAYTGGVTTALTAGLGTVGVSLSAGGDHVFEVSHLGDQVVLTLQQGRNFGAKADAKIGLFNDAAEAQVSAGVKRQGGQGLVARFASAESAAREVARLYRTGELDLDALASAAREVSFLSESQTRLQAKVQAAAQLSSVVNGLRDEDAPSSVLNLISQVGDTQDSSLAAQLSRPFGVDAGVTVKAGGSATWTDTDLSNNTSVTHRQARRYELYAKASAWGGVAVPSLTAMAVNQLGVAASGAMAQPLAQEADRQETQGVATVAPVATATAEMSIEQVTSELAITQSRRDNSLQGLTRSFKFAAPQGMTLERLARTAPGYARQIAQASGTTLGQVEAMFQKIQAEGCELVLTAQLKPSVAQAWNRDHSSALQALEFERPRFARLADYEREKNAIHAMFAKRLESLSSDEANMDVSALALHQSESSDQGIALNAVLLKVSFTAGAGLGRLLDKVSFARPSAAISADPSVNQEVSRLLAESEVRRHALLSQLTSGALPAQ